MTITADTNYATADSGCVTADGASICLLLPDNYSDIETLHRNMEVDELLVEQNLLTLAINQDILTLDIDQTVETVQTNLEIN